MSTRTIVYSALGNLLEVFGLDLATGDLARLQSFGFECVVQYAWANRARTMLYVVSSASGPMAKVKLPHHFVQAFRILPTGAIEPAQPPVRLGNRPLYIALDADERNLLIAYNGPSDVTVHKVGVDGTVGEQIQQPPLYFGLTVHQVRVTPHGNLVVVPACAHDKNGIPPGCVDLFDYREGRLTPRARIAADPARAGKWRGVTHGAQGFAARHVDFHPTRPWMYLLVETQGELHLYDCDESGVAPTPRYIKSTLEGAPTGPSAQLGSGVHVHPNGRIVYVSNRAWDTEPFADEKVFVGGANTIAVFEIDQSTGEPVLIQQIDTQGIFPRTFGIDASGRALVVGNQEPGNFRDGNTIRRVVPSLVIFRIEDDGRLAFLNKYDHPDNGEVCFWVDVISPCTTETGVVQESD